MRKYAERKAWEVQWIVHMYMLRKGNFEMRKIHQRDRIKRKVKF